MTTPVLSATRPAHSPLRRRLAHPRVVLAVILVSQLMVVLDASIVNIALPDIRTALGFTAEDLSWVVNAYTLTFGGLLLLGARAGDLLGRRRTFLAGIGVFVAASLAGGLAASGGTLLAARAIQGVGGAFAAPAALALLMTLFPEPRERTRAIGLFTAVSIGGATIGLVAGGMLTQWVSWRWVFFVNVPIGLALIGAAALVLTETPRRTGHFDISGALTSTAGMTALVYGFVRAAEDGWSDTWTIGVFAMGALLLGTFLAIERRAAAPITPLRLFADRTRASSYLVRLLLVAGMMGMFFFLTQFLQGVLGYTALAAGMAFIPLTVMLFVASQLSARVLSERFDPQRLMIVGLLFSTSGLWWLSHLSENSSYIALVAPLLVFGLGNGLAFVPLTAAGLQGVAPADAGAASGLVNVMQQVGGSLGLAILVTVFGTASRHASIVSANPAEQARHAFIVGADRGFLVASALIAASLAMVLFGMRRPRAHEPVIDTEPEAVLVTD
ncbi:MAG TPA: MFS transporter [Jatrophihabitantaceae bacterium]|nr:MFS transporter [Jatrophihabitantaceae bacterium]